MAQQTPNTPNSQEPFIPPQYLIILSLIGFAVAIFVGLTQPEFGVIGYGGLAFGILALLMWVLLAPQQARSVFTGRIARFGGTSVLVTILLLAAMVLIYIVVRNAGLHVDLTQDYTYSLSPESRQAIAAIGADPNAPKVHMIAFYGPSQAGTRDQTTLLLEDYAKTSDGKIDYEFVDPERAPQTASLYKVTSAGAIAVAKVDPATGQPDAANAQVATSASQETLTNNILRVSASGVFNAYFLQVQDGEASQMSVLKQVLTQAYNWHVNDVSLLELTTPGGQYNLDDPNVTGQVIIVPGGSGALSDDELKVLQDFVAKGGDLIIYAGTNLNDKRTSLATASNLNDWLKQDFGISFNSDVVIDKTQAFQTPLRPIATTLDGSSYITTTGIPRGQSAVVFEVPNSITIADTAPENVTDTALIRSTADAYSKANLQDIFDNKIDKADGDASGPFVLAASAENAQTGARIVLIGSTALASDSFATLQGADNLSLALNSLVWTTKFDDFATQVTVPQQQRPQDTPIFADQQALRNINFITIVLLPFGILGIGILVWWNNRERAR